MTIFDVNWIAIIVGTFLSFIVGWIWYSPKLFGKKWMEGVGFDPNNPPKPCPISMIVQLLATFLFGWSIGITALNNDLYLAILMILTVAIFIFANGTFVKKKLAAIIIESSFIIVIGIIMIAVQGIF